MKTKSWREAWRRIGSQQWNAQRRRDAWQKKLQQLATRSRRDPWRLRLATVAHQHRQHRDSGQAWRRRLEVITKAARLRERRRDS